MLANDAVNKGGICCTSTTGIPKLPGSLGINSARALGPPVETPIARISNPLTRFLVGLLALIAGFAMEVVVLLLDAAETFDIETILRFLRRASRHAERIALSLCRSVSILAERLSADG